MSTLKRKPGLRWANENVFVPNAILKGFSCWWSPLHVLSFVAIVASTFFDFEGFFSIDIILFSITFLPAYLKYHFILVQLSNLHLTVRFKLLNQTPSVDSKDNSSGIFSFNFSALTLPEQHLIHTFPSTRHLVLDLLIFRFKDPFLLLESEGFEARNCGVFE